MLLERVNAVVRSGAVNGKVQSSADSLEANMIIKALTAAIRGPEKPVPEPEPESATKNEFGPEQTRPKGDYRSAEEIINTEGNGILKNLDDKPKEDLKKQVGDYETDPDAAYRAAKVLEHIEKYDENGEEIKNGGKNEDKIDSVGNGRIDGYFKGKGGKLEANPKTEAGRLQDFGKYGYQSLKGGIETTPNDGKPQDIANPPPRSGPSPSRSPAEIPFAESKRPKGDNRSAQEIIDDNPTLDGLTDEEIKKGLKEQVGDYEKDADAAYRASQVIDYIKNVDEKGQSIDKVSNGNNPNNSRIDGYFKGKGGKLEANPNTEAGRLQDFIKDGYGSLKGIDGKSVEEKIDNLNAEAMNDAIKDAGGDASKLGKNYFTDGKTDASGADKAAALMQLSETLAKYKQGQKAFEHDHYLGDEPDPVGDREKFIKETEDKINKLAQDADVQKFMNDKVPETLRNNVEKDPNVKAELQRRYDETANSQALVNAFNQEGADGKPISTTDAVASFMEKPSFYAQALGIGPNLQKALEDAPKEIQDKIKQAYDDITSGKDLENLIAGGMPADQALIATGTNKAIFDTLFDEEAVKKGTEKFEEATAKYARDELMNGKSLEEIYAGLGVTGPDDPRLLELVEKNMDSLYPDKNNRPSAGEIVAAIRGVNDMMRHGSSFDNAIANVSDKMGNKLPEASRNAYKAGLMHGASGIMLAGALGANIANGKRPSDVGFVAQNIQATSLLTVGGAKFVRDQMDRSNAQTADPKNSTVQKWNAQAIAAVKDIENFGKGTGILGYAVGLIAGSIDASNAAAKGDQVAAGFKGTFAALNGLSAVAGAVEVGGYVLGRLASPISSTAFRVATAIEGIGGVAGAVIGGIATLGAMIYMAVESAKADMKRAEATNKWLDEVTQEFGEFGITPPDRTTTLAPNNEVYEDKSPSTGS